MVSGHVKTQLIAHDKEVYDIAFSRAGGGRDMFASVGTCLCLAFLCFCQDLILHVLMSIALNYCTINRLIYQCFNNL